MSREKKLNVKGIIKRAKIALGITKDIDLAGLLNITHGAIAMWKQRGNIDLVSIVILCKHVNIDWLVFGRGDMYVDEIDTLSHEILSVLQDMPDEHKKDVLRYAEDKRDLSILRTKRGSKSLGLRV